MRTHAQVVRDFKSLTICYAPGPDGIKRHGKGETASWESFAMQGQNVIDFRIYDEDIIAVIIPEEYSQIPGTDMRDVARFFC